jgi:NADPH2:quinone reductase
MYAIRIHEPGDANALSWEEVPDPAPGPGEVLVEVAAAGLNFIDVYHRTGLYPVDPPFTPGLEGAGIVRALGSEVTGFKEGDRVAWTSGLGTYAERVTRSVDAIVSVPSDVDLDTAAAVMLQGMTAHYLTHDTFPLRPGHRCLIHAGAGGVGLLLIQIAKMRGAEVFTTVGSEEKGALAITAGADHVIHYGDVDFGEAVESIAGPKSLDVVYDGVGRSVFDRSLELLKKRGMMVTFGNASGPVDPISPLRLSQGGSLFLTRPTLFDHIASREELLQRAHDLFGWIAADELEVRIGARVPLAEAGRAHEMLEGRRTTGKVLLVP